MPPEPPQSPGSEQHRQEKSPKPHFSLAEQDAWRAGHGRFVILRHFWFITSESRVEAQHCSTRTPRWAHSKGGDSHPLCARQRGGQGAPTFGRTVLLGPFRKHLVSLLSCQRLQGILFQHWLDACTGLTGAEGWVLRQECTFIQI